MFDRYEIQPYFHLGWVKIAYNPHIVGMRENSFGERSAWEINTTHDWASIAYPLAAPILESQHELLQLLKNVVDALLAPPVEHPQQLGRQAWEKLVGSNFQDETTPGEKQCWRSPAFSAAPRFDIETIAQILGSYHDAALDKLSEAQRDALHVRQLFDQAKQIQHAQPSQQARTQFRRQILVYRFQNAEEWKWVMAHVNDVLQEWRKCQDDSRVDSLTQNYKHALIYLEAVFEVQLRSHFEYLQYLLLQVPQFSHYWRFREGKWHVSADSKTLFNNDKLFWCLCELTYSRKPSSAMSQAALIRMLEQLLLSGNDDHRPWIDQQVLDTVSDILVLYNAQRDLSCGVPQHGVQLTFDEARKVVRGSCHRMAFDATRKVYTRCADLELDDMLNDFVALPRPASLSTRKAVEQYVVMGDCLRRIWAKFRGKLDKSLPDDQKCAELVAARLEVLLPLSPDEDRQQELEELLSKAEAEG